jgi:hypothetical protein
MTIDNTQRQLLKQQHPEFFTLSDNTVVGIPMQAMGNLSLLNNPTKLQVQC